MTILTAGGSFAGAYMRSTKAEIVSNRELSDKEFAEKLSRADVVIHNASTIICPNISVAVERNFEFTKKLVEILKEVNPSVHLILLSSMGVLSSKSDQKYEDVLQMTPYAYSKYLAETYCLKSDLEHVSCIRFSTLFFKDPSRDGLSKLIFEAVKTGKISLINNGEARRDFLPLDIAVRYVDRIAALEPKDKTIINLASGESTSFADVAKMLTSKLGSLDIENIEKTETHQVLSSFKTTNVDQLGRIPFSMADQLNSYIDELRA